MILKFVLVLSECIVVLTKNNNIKGHISGAVTSRIEDFPHSVFLSISRKRPRVSTCGGSLLTQSLVITAAHCFHSYSGEVAAYTGSVVKYEGTKTKAIYVKVHEHYNHTSDGCDVALVKLEKNLKLGPNVKRVALLKNPPLFKTAKVAGWGWVDSIGTKTKVLKHISNVTILDHATCNQEVGSIPEGVICGRDYDDRCYPEKGDSGSALVIDNFILLGIVSYKIRAKSNNTVVYTDVTYYYDWIVKNAEILMNQFKNCDSKEKLSRMNKYFVTPL